MKNLLSLILAVLLLCAAIIPTAALQPPPEPGDEMGWVLYTNIVTYINGVPIRSYNIGGMTYVVAEDLAGYGFTVRWEPDAADGILRISSGSGIVTATYSPEANTHTPGERAMPYLFTRILTYMAGEPVWAANIGGLTCVSMDDLAYFFAEDYVWDAEHDALRLTLRENCAAVVPDQWQFDHVTPGYDKDRAVDGTSAMWSFAKTADGSFTLTASSGETSFTPQISFGADRMSYRVDFEKKLLGLAGSNWFESARHTIAAHRTVVDTIHAQKLFSADNLDPDPQYFRGYAMQNRARVNELLAMAKDATAVWRVYVNGELIPGLPITAPSQYYQSPFGRYQTYQEYTYLYDRRIPLDTVETVRIELVAPSQSADDLITPTVKQPETLHGVPDTMNQLLQAGVTTTDDQLLRIAPSEGAYALYVQLTADTVYLHRLVLPDGEFTFDVPIPVKQKGRGYCSIRVLDGVTYLEYGQGALGNHIYLFGPAGMREFHFETDEYRTRIGTDGRFYRYSPQYAGCSYTEIRSYVEKITSRDDWFYDRGHIALVDGMPTLVTDARVTIGDPAHNLDALYAELREMIPTYPPTLDEQIARNVARIEAAQARSLITDADIAALAALGIEATVGPVSDTPCVIGIEWRGQGYTLSPSLRCVDLGQCFIAGDIAVVCGFARDADQMLCYLRGADEQIWGMLETNAAVDGVVSYASKGDSIIYTRLLPAFVGASQSGELLLRAAETPNAPCLEHGIVTCTAGKVTLTPTETLTLAAVIAGGIFPGETG